MTKLKKTFQEISNDISKVVSSIDMEGCDITMEEAFKMVEFLQNRVSISSLYTKI